MSSIEALEEPPVKFPTYEAAAKAACKWAEQGKVKVDVKRLVAYESKNGPYDGQIVGCGYQTSPKVQTDIIRIDNDPKAGGTAIHFNAKNQSDTSIKYAAVIEPTINMTPAERDLLYSQYVKALHGRSGQTIWNWWKTGVIPGSVEAEAQAEDGVEAGAGAGAA